MKKSSYAIIVMLVITLSALLLVAGCGSSQDEPATIEVIINTPGPITPAADGSGYPAPAQNAVASYPGSQNSQLSETPPDIDVDIPSPGADFGSVGGIMVREISGEGFIPLTPIEVALAEVKFLDTGEPGYLAHSDESLKADLPGTGIFIFNNVPPGQYGLVIDMGFTQLLALDENGETLLFDVEAGQILDLGHIFVSFG
ncbi:MAG: hypothetical protein KDE09_06320 [Anaerolineales bacterium]|nr:hypothetical protein [Anaerolineales bacterium]MCB8961851.1 hypothetical protein [Ardenticatenales bacterium]